MRDPATRERARAIEASGAGKAGMDGTRALFAEFSSSPMRRRFSFSGEASLQQASQLAPAGL